MGDCFYLGFYAGLQGWRPFFMGMSEVLALRATKDAIASF